MNKDTALARLDKARKLIERLPEDANVLEVYLNRAVGPEETSIVHVFKPSGIEGEYKGLCVALVASKRVEYRFYPAKDMENAGYLVLVDVVDDVCDSCAEDDAE